MQVAQWQWLANAGWIQGAPDAGAVPNAHVVLAFGSTADLKVSNCLELIRQAFPNAHLFGCTTAGEILGTGVRYGSVAVTAFSLEHSQVLTAKVSILGPERSLEAGTRLAQLLPAAGLRHVFVLSEGLLVNGSDLVRGLNAALPRHVSVSGGFAGDCGRFLETYVWCDGQPEQSTAAALGFYGDRLRIGLGSSTGWDPFGPERVVTKSRGTVLYELDNQPALALYKRYLGEYAKDLPASGLVFPLELTSDESQDRVMRALLATNEVEQSVTLAGNIPEGTTARLMFASVEHLIAGAQVAGEDIAAQLGEIAPQLSLLVSCNGRRPVLGPRLEEETEAVGDALGGQAALTGFYSYGEIAPVSRGGRAHLLNQTMTVTSLAES